MSNIYSFRQEDRVNFAYRSCLGYILLDVKTQNKKKSLINEPLYICESANYQLVTPHLVCAHKEIASRINSKSENEPSELFKLMFPNPEAGKPQAIGEEINMIELAKILSHTDKIEYNQSSQIISIFNILKSQTKMQMDDLETIVGEIKTTMAAKKAIDPKISEEIVQSNLLKLQIMNRQYNRLYNDLDRIQTSLSRYENLAKDTTSYISPLNFIGLFNLSGALSFLSLFFFTVLIAIVAIGMLAFNLVMLIVNYMPFVPNKDDKDSKLSIYFHKFNEFPEKLINNYSKAAYC